jgi:hypothetical protein
MASKYWIKLYHEILHDPKMGRLPDNVWRRAIELFLLAGELDEGGKLPETEEIAWLLRQPNPEKLEAELEHLEQVKILALIPDGWLVTKFADRQAAVSDADRMKEYRNRKRASQFSTLEPEKEPVTEPLPDGNKPVTNPVTKRNTDTDKDKEERDNRARAHVRDPLTDALKLQGTVDLDNGKGIPEDQYFEYRDEFLAIYREMTGEYPDLVVKDEIPKLVEAGATPESWRESWRQCKLKWTGKGKVPVDRVIEVCSKFGGDYEKWRRSTFPDNSNGRDSPGSNNPTTFKIQGSAKKGYYT